MIRGRHLLPLIAHSSLGRQAIGSDTPAMATCLAMQSEQHPNFP